MYDYRASVVDLYDGDTLRLRVDLGCDVRIDMAVRLNGLNAPELNTQAGKDAKAYALQWLRDNCTPDAGSYVVRIATQKDKREKYGRYLGTIFGTAKGKDKQCLNDDMIAAGHAKAWDGKGARPS